MQGVADSGKSTIVEKLYRLLFDEASTFVISNNMEQQFGLQDAVGPASPFLICCGTEIGKDFRLDQKQFQQMCSGERVSAAVKNKSAVQDVWRLPLVLAGNQAPSYVDDSGSIARRLAVVRFTVPLETGQKDPALGQKMAAEMPLTLQKMGRAYRAQVDNGCASADFWKVAGHAFASSRTELKAATNPLEAFCQSDALEWGPGLFLKLAEFKDAAREWARARAGSPWAVGSMSLGTDSLADVLGHRGVRVSQKQRRTVRNVVSNTVWLDGVALSQE